MFVRIPRGWEKPEREATDEALFRDRRRLCKAIAAGPILLGPAAALLAGARPATAAAETEADPTADLYPAKRNPRYRLDRPLTDEKLATTYNNFYEFGGHKQISDRAQAMKIRPWEVRIDGMVEQEFTIGIDDLIRRMPLEERLYRLRCVEAWAMDVPWSGFAMKALVDLAKPLSSARYVVMQSLADKATMPGLRQVWYPWPYTDGLTIAEATNELAFMVTGAYGKPLPKQNGAPLRLATPWKYGFKSIKSIVRFTFTDRRPVNFWETVQGGEYGFWANVNPQVPHARWSQATERLLGGGSAETRLYNGYGEFVAHLYDDLKSEKLFM
jgi:sulfoxide reductase catalytic subunit YedY